MAREIVDDRMIGALHLRALTHKGLQHDPSREHVAIQTSTLDALMDGRYEGDTTIEELLRLGTMGIGTVQYLDGELIVVDGRAFAARHDGRIDELPGDTLTPFAVVTHFSPSIETEIVNATFDETKAIIDSYAPSDAPIVAVRMEGEFASLQLRSVEKQVPPYRHLSDVVDDQIEWAVPNARGVVVGFRFPDAAAGVEVPGWHVHFLAEDFSHGGHVISLEVVAAKVSVDRCDELHVELPNGVTLGEPGTANREMIRKIEGGD